MGYTATATDTYRLPLLCHTLPLAIQQASGTIGHNQEIHTIIRHPRIHPASPYHTIPYQRIYYGHNICPIRESIHETIRVRASGVHPRIRRIH
ncbi:MAG: hypothetical protein K1V88_02795 [Muribaculaceae bacterium]